MGNNKSKGSRRASIPSPSHCRDNCCCRTRCKVVCCNTQPICCPPPTIKTVCSPAPAFTGFTSGYAVSYRIVCRAKMGNNNDAPRNRLPIPIVADELFDDFYDHRHRYGRNYYRNNCCCRRVSNKRCCRRSCCCENDCSSYSYQTCSTYRRYNYFSDCDCDC
ncbi:unnamed protein product [Brachionus calyciflorus]|uniref:Uncharacterized protein n=1 Tax=Brachionus calyciflorus TaxID=104777 RepID=A0A813MY60_9BILA|nr:unnamed protein product [Brachionus calyciflorus]